MYFLTVDCKMLQINISLSAQVFIEDIGGREGAMQVELGLGMYPYVVPLPLGREERLIFLQAAFGSKTRLDILSMMMDRGLEQRVYEGELIEQLPYSNKTVIKHLGIMVKSGILAEGMERVKREDRFVWVKWFQLTEVGGWIALLLSTPEDLPEKRVRETFDESFEMISSSRVMIAEKYPYVG